MQVYFQEYLHTLHPCRHPEIPAIYARDWPLRIAGCICRRKGQSLQEHHPFSFQSVREEERERERERERDEDHVGDMIQVKPFRLMQSNTQILFVNNRERRKGPAGLRRKGIYIYICVCACVLA